jgi:ubiquinone/menaquinone biosynthesis C-methylase UbiE
MSFTVAGDKYDRFMGRYSRELAPRFIEFAGVEEGMAVVDVGCGPGALTESLVKRTGAENVAAADPSEPFVAAATERAAGADVRQAAAEKLPWEDDRFDAALSQLAVNFMRDADAGVSEMQRVVRPGGVVAACTWSYAKDMEMLSSFWAAAGNIDSGAPDEGSAMRYRSVEELDELWQRVGLSGVATEHLRVETTYTGFDDLWEPFTFGVGPAGAYLAKLSPQQREQVRIELFKSLDEPSGPFTLSATACAVRGSGGSRRRPARVRHDVRG